MTMMTSHSQTPKYEWSKLSILTEQLSYRGEEFLDHLGVEYYNCGKYLAGPCPVHGGDNRTAFNFFLEGDIHCNWVCYTHQCQTKNKSVFGLVQGVKGCSYGDAVECVCRFLGVRYDDIQANSEAHQINQRLHQQKVLSATRKISGKSITVETLHKSLVFPCRYYLNRGYSESVLTKYNVGFCNNKDKPMHNRCVVPVFDDSNEYIIGVTCRSIFDKHKCGLFHNPFEKCPSNAVEINAASKWRNQEGFNRESYLYNYWFSRYYIGESQVVVIVEGPGDVWRLEEAGVYNSVAVFGSGITEEQMIILEQSGAMIIVPLADNDDAGRLFRQRVKERCCRLFNVKNIEYEGKDIGELSVEYIQKHIKPQLDTFGSKK